MVKPVLEFQPQGCSKYNVLNKRKLFKGIVYLFYLVFPFFQSNFFKLDLTCMKIGYIVKKSEFIT